MNTRKSAFANLIRANAAFAAMLFAIVGAAKADPPAKTSIPEAARPTPHADVRMPAAREIIDKYVRTIGGGDVILAKTSRHTKGAMRFGAAGPTCEVESFAAAPDRLVECFVRGQGFSRTGYDGGVGWRANAESGPKEIVGKPLAQLGEQAAFYSALHDESKYTTIEVIELADLNGRPCYKLHLVSKLGNESFEFFDAQTGLLTAIQAARDIPGGGPVDVTTFLSDYKNFDGLMVPTTIKQRGAGREITTTLTLVEFNKVDPTTFEPPPEIKKK